MEKMLEVIISAIATYGTLVVAREESMYLAEIERLRNRLYFTRISLAIVTVAFGGFVYAS
tara:strand:- start:3130 stop:3309 length:180 start_codon:yes stop_codon:yes gene_type:complete